MEILNPKRLKNFASRNPIIKPSMNLFDRSLSKVFITYLYLIARGEGSCNMLDGIKYEASIMVEVLFKKKNHDLLD